MENAISVITENDKSLTAPQQVQQDADKLLGNTSVNMNVLKTGISCRGLSKRDWFSRYGDPTWTSNEKRRQFNKYKKSNSELLGLSASALKTKHGHKTGSFRIKDNGDIVETYIHPNNLVEKPRATRKTRPLEITAENAEKTVAGMSPEARANMLRALS